MLTRPFLATTRRGHRLGGGAGLFGS